MGINTVIRNDASEHNFNSSNINDTFDNFINDLRTLKEGGGNVLLPIELGSLPHLDKYVTTTLFPNPLTFAIYINNIIAEQNRNNWEKHSLFLKTKIKEIILLQYEDINKIFDFTFENNVISFTNKISTIELGAICELFPEECSSFLQKLTATTQSWYLENQDFDSSVQRGLKRQADLTEKFNRSLKIEFSEYPYDSKKKFKTGGAYLEQSNKTVLSLAAFTFLSHVDFLTHNHGTGLTNNFDLFNKWVIQGQDNILTNTISTFGEEQTKFYEHFLHEKVNSDLRDNFLYLLEKNNLITNVSYISREQFLLENPSLSQQNVQYELFEANQSYANYIQKLRTAVSNSDYEFLSKNLQNFNNQEYALFLNENPTHLRDLSFFPKDVTLETIKFLEKFNIYPYYLENNTPFFLLPLSLKDTDIAYQYFLHNPESQKSSYVNSVLHNILSNIKDKLIHVDFSLEASPEELIRTTFEPFFKFYKDCIKPNIENKSMKEPMITFEGFPFVFEDRALVKTFFTILEEHFTKDQVFFAMNIFISKMGDNPKLLTGLKDFAKTNNYDLSDARLAVNFFNSTYTSSFLSKLHKDISYSPNAQLNNSVVWWNVSSSKKLFTGKLFKEKALINAKNINNETLTDKYLSDSIKNHIKYTKYIENNSVSFSDLNTVLKQFDFSSTLVSSFDSLLSGNLEGNTDYLSDDEKLLSHNYCSNPEGIPDIVYYINLVIEGSFASSQFDNYQKDFVDYLNSNKQIGSNEFYNICSALHISTKDQDKGSTFNVWQKIYPDYKSSVFQNFISYTKWDDLLPSIFSSLPNKVEKDRFFKNLALAFASIETSHDYKTIINHWSALFNNYDNYDLNFDINISKFITPSTNLVVSNIQSVRDTFELSKKSITTSFVSYLDLSSLEQSLFKNIFFKEAQNPEASTQLMNIDFSLVNNISTRSSNYVHTKCKMGLSFSDLIDIVSWENIIDTDLPSHKVSMKKNKQEISTLFNRFIYAQELGKKLSDKEDAVHHKRKL